MDFVSDALASSRRFRVLTLVDDFTRECLALVVDNSLSGIRVAARTVLACRAAMLGLVAVGTAAGAVGWQMVPAVIVAASGRTGIV